MYKGTYFLNLDNTEVHLKKNINISYNEVKSYHQKS